MTVTMRAAASPGPLAGRRGCSALSAAGVRAVPAASAPRACPKAVHSSKHSIGASARRILQRRSGRERQVSLVTVSRHNMSVNVAAAVEEQAEVDSVNSSQRPAVNREDGRKPRVIIAGGGIGGLSSALSCIKRGMDVTVYEKVSVYKPFGGPIQLAGNALSALQAICPAIAERVIENGTFHGIKVNGLLDGTTGNWYVRFDTSKPSISRGVPLTIAISRYTLLDILAQALPKGSLTKGITVERYEKLPGGRVRAYLSNGEVDEADALIACDGIRSKVREQMKGTNPVAAWLDQPNYSGFTCYTGIVDYTPEDEYPAGYQVFLGNLNYFVTSDIGNGQSCWYAFKGTPAGGAPEEDMREALLDIYQGWCPSVVDRIKAAAPEDIERRDIYDRRPTLSWSDGPVAILGDAAHAMQPNMGQGGCQAIEDAYVLGKELGVVGAGVEAGGGGGAGGGEGVVSGEAVAEALRRYESRRALRAAAVMGFAGSASLMTTTYRGRLGEKPYPFYKYIPGAEKFWARVLEMGLPHPGAVFGQIVMMLGTGVVLDYLYGRFAALPEPEEFAPYCQLPGVSVPERLPEEAFKMKGVPGFAK